MTDLPETPSGQGGRHPARNAGSAFGWLAFGSIVLLGVLIGCTLWSVGPAGRSELLTRHGPAVIGIPAAILVATAVVCGARSVGGDFKLAVLGADSKGASALLASRLSVFAAVVIAIRALW